MKNPNVKYYKIPKKKRKYMNFGIFPLGSGEERK